jgi:hypothetical protein
MTAAARGISQRHAQNLNRHPGLDPGSTFFLAVAAKEGGCRIKSGMTKGARI